MEITETYGYYTRLLFICKVREKNLAQAVEKRNRNTWQIVNIVVTFCVSILIYILYLVEHRTNLYKYNFTGCMDSLVCEAYHVPYGTGAILCLSVIDKCH